MKPRIKQIEEDVILPRVLFYQGRRPRWITPSEICLILHILRKPLVQLYGRRCEDCVRRPLNVLPTTRHGSQVLLVTGSDAYCNGEKGNKAPVRDLNARDLTSLHSKRFRASSSRKLGQVQKRGMKCSRSNFCAITRLETLATQARTSLINTGPFVNLCSV